MFIRNGRGGQGLALIGLCLASFLAAHGQAPAKKSSAPAKAGSAPKYKGIWESVNIKEDLQLNDVFFVTPEVGWVAADKGAIFKTTDGGANWTAQLGGDPQSPDPAITQLRFIDEKTGWARQNEKLLRTTDGENWEFAGTLGSHAYDYAFTSLTNGVYLSYGNQIFHTRDGGKTWKHSGTCQARTELAGLTVNLGCENNLLQFVSPMVGFVAGMGSAGGVNATVFLKTEDGGATWSTAGVLEGAYSRNGSMFFLDENSAFYVDYYSKPFRTSDGGKTWKPLLNTSLAYRIRFADPEVGWSFTCAGHSCATAQLNFTVDGGQRWTSRGFVFPTVVSAFSLPRRDRGYVIGGHGMVYRYRVAPETEEVSAKAIAAPAMPGMDSPLDDQAAQIQQELLSLEQAIEKKTGQQIEVTATEEEAAAPASGATQESAGPGLAEEAAPQQLEALAGTVEGLNAEVPKFTGKFRNLNMIFTGLNLVGQLFGQAQGLKDSFSQLRKAKDVASISAALSQLTGQAQGLVQSTKSAFQSPQQ